LEVERRDATGELDHFDAAHHFTFGIWKYFAVFTWDQFG